MKRTWSFGNLRPPSIRPTNRKISTLLILISFFSLIYLILFPTKTTHVQRREIKIENLKYGMYNHVQDSFISQDSKNIIEKFEDNREKTGLLSSYSILDRLQKKEVELNEKLQEVEKMKSEMKSKRLQADKSINRNIQRNEKYNELRNAEKNSFTKMIKTINKLSSKVDMIFNHMKKSKKKQEERAKVINFTDQKKCSNPNVLFLVTSHSANTKRRQAIRNNWGDQNKFRIFKQFNLTYNVYFSVGIGKSQKDIDKTKKESNVFHDMLIVNREEDFYDLTRRVMASFEWAVNHCNFTYLFKVDDDIFINIPNVMAFISNDTIIKNSHRLYAGDMNMDAAVNRNNQSKYMVKYEEWPVETYPPYCSGGGFIISRDIVKSIVPYFDWVNPYKIDDVYVGIMVQRAKIDNIMYYEPVNRYQFWFYGNSTRCRFIKSSIVYHKVSNEACMNALTMKSIFSIPESMKIIDYFINKPPSLSDLPKANLPKERRFIQPVLNFEDSNE